MALDVVRYQQTMDPEPVQTRFLDEDDPDRRPGPLLGLIPQACQKIEQPRLHHRRRPSARVTGIWRPKALMATAHPSEALIGAIWAQRVGLR